LGATIAVAAVAIVVILIATSGGGKTTSPPPGQNTPRSPPARRINQPQHPCSATAPVTLEYFGDLDVGLPRLHARGLPTIIRQWVKTGRLKVEYRSLSTATGNAEAASSEPKDIHKQQSAALAAGMQNKAWYYIELFYREQGEEAAATSPKAISELAEQIPGLNLALECRPRSSGVQARITETRRKPASADSKAPVLLDRKDRKPSQEVRIWLAGRCVRLRRSIQGSAHGLGANPRLSIWKCVSKRWGDPNISLWKAKSVPCTRAVRRRLRCLDQTRQGCNGRIDRLAARELAVLAVSWRSLRGAPTSWPKALVQQGSARARCGRAYMLDPVTMSDSRFPRRTAAAHAPGQLEMVVARGGARGRWIVCRECIGTAVAIRRPQASEARRGARRRLSDERRGRLFGRAEQGPRLEHLAQAAVLDVVDEPTRVLVRDEGAGVILASDCRTSSSTSEKPPPPIGLIPVSSSTESLKASSVKVSIPQSVGG